MDDLTFSHSIVIARSPDAVYDMVADVTRMGEWSPICTGCTWDDGHGPTVGAGFTGRNQTPARTWETHCTVVAAEAGREFAFVVGDSFVRWGYSVKPVDGGTELTESWEFLPNGRARFDNLFGDDAEAQLADRRATAHVGIPATLAAIKQAAEAHEGANPGTA